LLGQFWIALTIFSPSELGSSDKPECTSSQSGMVFQAMYFWA
jgi:hypothetical protein